MSKYLMAPKTKACEEEWRERIELWKRTFMKGASDDELVLFEEICKRTGLSPEMKQIHAIPREDYKLKKTVFTFQVSIDGYRLLADRTGKYAPGKEPTFNYDKDGMLLSATSYVKKLTGDGTWHEVGATAFYNEYVQTFMSKDTGKQEPTKFWKQSEHNQLAKCAEALALRKAFPADLGNIYTVDEMAQALNEANGSIVSQEPAVDNTSAFKDKFKSIENMDYDLNDFLDYYCKEYKKEKKDAIRGALKYEDKFSKTYLDWVEKQKIVEEKKNVDGPKQLELLN